MRRITTLALSALLAVALSGCLGTVVRSPQSGGHRQTTTQVHLIAAPRELDGSICRNGFAEVSTFVPLWGVVVGYFTLGIVVPMTTSYTCVGSR